MRNHPYRRGGLTVVNYIDAGVVSEYTLDRLG